MLDTDREKYIGKYYNFKEPTPVTGTKTTFQLQLNGAYYPQFAATAEEMYRLASNQTLRASDLRCRAAAFPSSLKHERGLPLARLLAASSADFQVGAAAADHGQEEDREQRRVLRAARSEERAAGSGAHRERCKGGRAVRQSKQGA